MCFCSRKSIWLLLFFFIAAITCCNKGLMRWAFLFMNHALYLRFAAIIYISGFSIFRLRINAQLFLVTILIEEKLCYILFYS